MSNDNVAFRSSFRGYNKKDVYKYLETLNRDIAKKNTELEMELSGLKDKNAKLIAECTYAS
ncbi:MAG: DivIVA domain-containing protein, partial [Clostridia bacterium]|nr:DivIVA domain-containing protein [Clostridia bacterium]